MEAAGQVDFTKVLSEQTNSRYIWGKREAFSGSPVSSKFMEHVVLMGPMTGAWRKVLSIDNGYVRKRAMDGTARALHLDSG